MVTEKTHEILGVTLIVEPHISIPSGRTSTDPEMLKTAEKPPSGINTTMPNVDDERLKDFRGVRNDVEKLMSNYGVKVTRSAWLIVQENWPFVLEMLQEKKTRFEGSLVTFLEEHDQANLEFPSRFPGWEQVIENKLLTAEEIKYRFGFRWTAHAMAPAPEDLVNPEDSGLDDLVGSLGDSLFHEVAVDARKSFKAPKDSTYDLWFQDPGKVECTAKALGPLRRISDKLGNLLLLHPSAVHVRDLLEDVLSKLPPKGPFVGSNFMMIKGVLEVITSEKAMEGYGQQIADSLTSSGEYLDVWAAKGQDANAARSEEAAPTEEMETSDGATPRNEEEDGGTVFDMGMAAGVWGDAEPETDEAEETEDQTPPMAKEPAAVEMGICPF